MCRVAVCLVTHERGSKRGHLLPNCVSLCCSSPTHLVPCIGRDATTAARLEGANRNGRRAAGVCDRATNGGGVVVAVGRGRHRVLTRWPFVQVVWMATNQGLRVEHWSALCMHSLPLAGPCFSSKRKEGTGIDTIPSTEQTENDNKFPFDSFPIQRLQVVAVVCATHTRLAEVVASALHSCAYAAAFFSYVPKLRRRRRLYTQLR
ncbi:hypothetical protein GE09DRAFT_787429 [Coniochaeta sp. 2T2.1]|nr:hypothetical protein GE09DRAFT_787429 [Coniochaeta sp. 2T2.1]